ncbi:MAG TPA: DUF4382 domain-containing protein, partial [Candidatus Saccharimonadales bacterium]|nr:DUF4382 domain-containing protein [Candidatus Saccharimonadales bacterium]
GGGGGGGTGTLSVPITDAPFPAHDGCLAGALVTVDGVEAKVADGFHDVALVDPDPDGTVTLDLLTLRAGVMDSLAVSDLPTGTISEIRLHIVDSVLVFEDGSPDAEFKVPSGSASGLKVRIDPPALVAAGQTTTLILDVDLADSFHTRGLGGDPTCDDLKEGENRVIFSPLVRANNESTDAILLGTVIDGSGMPLPDVEVSAYPAGTDIVASPDPQATTFSAPDGIAGMEEGDYALLLPAGTYDLYLRDQGVDEKTLAAEDVVATAGESLEGVDLTLLP